MQLVSGVVTINVLFMMSVFSMLLLRTNSPPVYLQLSASMKVKNVVLMRIRAEQ